MDAGNTSPRQAPLKLTLKLGADSIIKTVEGAQKLQSDSSQTDTDSSYPNDDPVVRRGPSKLAAEDQAELDEKTAEEQVQFRKEAMLLVSEKVRQNAYQRLYEWFLRQHERQDPHQIFAEPVTDQIAPRYSHVIKQPMSFFDIRNKIKINAYKNLDGIRTDFKLCFDNCITYNTSDTIFYQTGKKMLSFSRKLLSAEKLEKILPQLKFLSNLPKLTARAMLELFIDGEDLNMASKIISEPPTPTEGSFHSEPEIEAVMSDHEQEIEALKSDSTGGQSADEKARLTPFDIRRQAIEAAKLAKERLAKIRPGGNVSYLYREKDGSTRLNVLIPSAKPTGKPSRKVATIGDLCGDIAPGCGKPTLPTDTSHRQTGVTRKRKTELTPLAYINYGPFGSYAPALNQAAHDKYTEKELSIVRGAYGSAAGALYAESMTAFVQDSASWVRDHVDRLLDTYTDGKHKSALEFIVSKKNAARGVEADLKNDGKPAPPKPTTDQLNSLKSLKELGVNIDFLTAKPEDVSPPKKLKSEARPTAKPKVAPHPLDATSGHLKTLQKMQHKRMGERGKIYGDKTHLEPSKNEVELAGKVGQSFRAMIQGQGMGPENLIPVQGIRSTLGVRVNAAVTKPGN